MTMGHANKLSRSHDSGNFLSSKSNPVWETKVISEDETPEANIREYLIKMQSGSVYNMNFVMPKRKKIDTILTRTAAWLTSHDSGFEKEYALRAADGGIPVMTFTPQQNLLRFGKMSRSSHDYVESTKYFAAVHGLDTEHLMTAGPSRGGDHAISMGTVAGDHDMEAIYIDAEAPCMGDALDFRKFSKQVRMLPGEVPEFIRLTTENHMGYAAVLLNTLASKPRHLFQQFKEAPTLINGSVGRYARKLPEDANGFVQMYDVDGLAFNYQWGEILDPFKGVSQHMREGTHIFCVSPDARDRSLERVMSMRDGIMEGYVSAHALRRAIAEGNPIFASNPEARPPVAVAAS